MSLLHLKQDDQLPVAFRRVIPPEILTHACMAASPETRDLAVRAIALLGPDAPEPAPPPPRQRRPARPRRGGA